MNTLDAKEQYRQHPRSQEYFYWIELLPPAMLKDGERVLGKKNRLLKHRHDHSWNIMSGLILLVDSNAVGHYNAALLT